MVFASDTTRAHAPVAGTATHTTSAGSGGLASHIPGTRAHEEKKSMQHSAGGIPVTTAGAGAAGGRVGTAGTMPGTGATGTTGTGGGLASKIPGTKAHAVAHSHNATHASALASSHPTTTSSHAPGHHTHTTGQHGNLRPGEPGTKTVTTTTTTVVPHPSVGDKVSGKVDVAIGKLTRNPGKVAVGEIKQTEGKKGLEGLGWRTRVGGLFRRRLVPVCDASL